MSRFKTCISDVVVIVLLNPVIDCIQIIYHGLNIVILCEDIMTLQNLITFVENTDIDFLHTTTLKDDSHARFMLVATTSPLSLDELLLFIDTDLFPSFINDKVASVLIKIYLKGDVLSYRRAVLQNNPCLLWQTCETTGSILISKNQTGSSFSLEGILCQSDILPYIAQYIDTNRERFQPITQH